MANIEDSQHKFISNVSNRNSSGLIGLSRKLVKDAGKNGESEQSGTFVQIVSQHPPIHDICAR